MTSARDQIRALVEQHYNEEFPKKPFVPGESPVPVTGKTFDHEEIQYLVDSSIVSSECNGLKEVACCLGKRETA